MRWFLLLLVTGCAPVSQQYVKLGATPEQMNQDRAACRLQVEQMVNQSSDPLASAAAQVRHWFALCLEAHGWIKRDSTTETK